MFARYWDQPMDRIRSIFVRPVPSGYVFRAPNPKVFSAPDHYLVNEVQRDAIVAIMAPGRAPLLRALKFGGFLLAAVAGVIVRACETAVIAVWM